MPEPVLAGAVPSAPHAVELLYFDGCPHYEALLPHLRELLHNVDAGNRIQLHRIRDEQAAQRERFLGSPTVRVDGRDVEPGASERRDFGMTCRLYPTIDGLCPIPPDDWILDALAQPTNG